MMCAGADFNGKIRHSFQLALVPVHDGRMNLKRQTDFTAILHPLHRAIPAAGKAAEFVVFFTVERVE